MAVKKPLVITGGQIEQLQSGDTIEHPGVFQRQNNNAGTVTIGQAVYVDGAGTVDLAQADAAGTKDVLGLVADVTIVAAASGGIQTDGVLAATTGQWDAVTGQVGGLTAGSKYYLDAATAGSLTATPPSGAGEFVAPIGIAMSTTEMEITILVTVKL
jgi:hypothetical protein